MSAKPHDVTGEKEADAALQRLGQAARAQLLGSLTPQKEAEARRRFRDSLTREVSSHALRTAPARRMARWGGTTAGIAAVAAGVFFVMRARASRPLTYEVDSPSVAEQEYILVPAAAPSAHVHFSDGSELTVAPGGRGRIAGLDTHGATIGLENGKASLQVVHREGTHWSVDAGPFAIAVTGTAFDVAWSGADELFEVVLKSGSITVRGPLAAAGIQLGAGQKLVANLREGQLRIERFAPAPAGATTSADSNPVVEWHEEEQRPGTAGSGETGVAAASGEPALLAPQRTRSSNAAPSLPDEPKPGWSKRVAAGDFNGVLAEVQQRGLDVALAQSSLADLIALADAARYGGRADIAHRALLTQRDRFQGSGAAHTAAFLLGRLADGPEGKPAAAIGWYDRYLSESPGGEFASEAMGRKLVAVQRVSGSQAARPVAEEYLRRFPRGPYAAKARELSTSP